MGIPVVNALISGPTNNPPKQYQQVVVLVNRDFSEQLTQPNTKYIVKHNFNLNGQTLNIPENCIIEIDGGSIQNGTLVGNHTILLNANKLSQGQILQNITLSGTWGSIDEDYSYTDQELVNLCVLYYDKVKKQIVWYNGNDFVTLPTV